MPHRSAGMTPSLLRGQLAILAQGEITITGTLDNRCTDADGEPGDLVIHTVDGKRIALGTLDRQAVLETSAGLDVTDDPSLPPEDFEVHPTERSATPVPPVCAALVSTPILPGAGAASFTALAADFA